MGAIINAMRDTGSISKPQFAAMDNAHKKILTSVDKDEGYKHAQFIAALKKFEQTVPR